MKQHTYIAIILSFALFTSFQVAVAQDNNTNPVTYIDQIAVENPSISKEKGITNVAMDIDLSGLKLNRNDLILITPVIFSNQTGETVETVELEPLAVKGKLRSRILDRPFNWEGKPLLTMPEANQIVRANGTRQLLQYQTTLPFHEWQRDARLVLKTEVIGCADCSDLLPDRIINPKILPDLFVPDYRMSYLTPEVEPIKQRSESYSAHLNYVVGRWDLLPNFENNAAELAKVDKIIKELQDDDDLTITDFTISGYASPEDLQERNMLLSQRRAETFATHIEKRYGYNRDQFKVEWFGEDWEGLREAVNASSLPNKEDILTIIDTEPNMDARDALLTALDNGATYSRLLREYYPPLRRNEYHISFVSRPFSVEEAARVLETRPKLLSLNEMFLVAETYPEDSSQYKEVFDIAANTFPENATANINAAVGELRANNPDAALEYLQKVEDTPSSWNLLGIAYALKGDLEQAKLYLTRAAEKGHADATHNLDQLEKYINDIE